MAQLPTTRTFGAATGARLDLDALIEQGCDLVDGVITVEDTSVTTQVSLHSDLSAINRYHCVFLLDHGSLPSSTSGGACEKKNLRQLQRTIPPRPWGAFGSSISLQT